MDKDWNNKLKRGMAKRSIGLASKRPELIFIHPGHEKKAIKEINKAIKMLEMVANRLATIYENSE